MRATFSTHFNAAGANIDVIEHCLAHVPGNRVRAAYNRHAYQVERREMLQAWAARVDTLRSGLLSTVPRTCRDRQTGMASQRRNTRQELLATTRT
jgi:hypothetical protein